MPVSWRAAVVAVTLLSGCASAPKAEPPMRFAAPLPVDNTVEGREERILAAAPKLEALLTEGFEKNKFPSMTFGVVLRDKLVWTRGWALSNPAAGEQKSPDAHVVYRIGSVTKLFAGLALLKLRDEGKIDFDAPAARYLPELAEVLYPTRDSAPITVRHLFTHTSGLPKSGNLATDRSGHDLTESELLDQARNVKLAFAPGTQRAYSNLGMALAGLIVQRVSGAPSFTAYVQQQILAPLGMTHSYWDHAEVPSGVLALGHVQEGDQMRPEPNQLRLGVAAAAGGLYMDLADFARFASFELSAWPPRDDPDEGPVRRSSVRESQFGSGFGLGGGPTFGVNWAMAADGPEHMVFHTGSTSDYSATIWMLPERGLAVVGMVNGGQASALDGLAKRALKLVSESDPPPEPKLSASLEQALTRIEALIAAPSEKAAAELFSPAYIAAITPAQILGTFQKLQAVGPCAGRRVMSASSEQTATVRVKCEKAELEFSYTVRPEPPFLIEGLLVRGVK